MTTLPGPTNRTTIVGSTGTGKSVFAIWLLSSRDWRKKRPWYVVNSKGDKLIDECVEAAGGRDFPLTSRPTKKPGLYVIRPRPDHDDEALETFFTRLWEMEDCGVYIDEGYMIPRNSTAMTMLLTQGRSKNIEMITLSQRPVYMSRFVFTEAEYIAIFRLNDDRDRDTVKGMTGVTCKERLPKYHCLWYDGGNDELAMFSPVPYGENLVNLFRQRKGRKIMKAL